MSFSKSKVRIAMFRSLFVFLLSFFGSNTGSLASESWVVPEKQMSVASGHSDETRQLLTALGASQFDMRKLTLDGDLRQELLGIAEQAMLETSEVKLNMSVEDLGLDSLGLVEAIFSIEETFSVNVPFNANDPTASDFDISSVGAIIKAIDKLVMEKSN